MKTWILCYYKYFQVPIIDTVHHTPVTAECIFYVLYNFTMACWVLLLFKCFTDPKDIQKAEGELNLSNHYTLACVYFTWLNKGLFVHHIHNVHKNQVSLVSIHQKKKKCRQSSILPVGLEQHISPEVISQYNHLFLSGSTLFFCNSHWFD